MDLCRISKGNHWIHLLPPDRRQKNCCQDWTFFEKEFLAKGVSGRKVELDEIVDPSLKILSSTTEVVPNVPSIAEEEGAHDENHGELVKKTERRSARLRKSPEWFGNPVLLTMMNLQPTQKQWKAPS
jgi:hypothetical protein